MSQKTSYDMVIENTYSTVVAEYTPMYSTETHYQSESELEQVFIADLKAQAYEYVSITNEASLIANLRTQLEKLNNIHFTEDEWTHFFKEALANSKHGIVQKTETIQQDFVKPLHRADGTTKNIRLIEKKNIHDNHLQVINQYATDAGMRDNRYDVTVLINGLPLVHVELKRRGVSLKDAFNQINRYQRESFWAGSGLFEYVQLFVISDGTHTKYYSNTVRDAHVKKMNQGNQRTGKRTSDSFEFTSFWADKNNCAIEDLRDFTKTFFAKHTLLNIITKYCVFTEEKRLLVMRPYQIVATEEIIRRIESAHNYKKYGSVQSGGYVWHTTGSGKTLTSFKTTVLAKELPFIKKVLFVVDRRDLDYQTMKEYDKFEKGAANSNTSTRVLTAQLEDATKQVIITTIQKLHHFMKRNKDLALFTEEIVLIFDECHRSQFGDMHSAITKSLKRYYLFGFTGTPIFADNASVGGNIMLKTTEQVFGDNLHKYTIVDAIRDKNVLPFKVDYVSTMCEAENIEDKKVRDIDKEEALCAPERVSKIVTYMREHFDNKTKRNKIYALEQRRINGFNSIFAVASIDLAKKYYAEFKRQLKDASSDKQLKIALIYSFSMNEEHGLSNENSEDTCELDENSRNFLNDAISDYNKMFHTSFDTSSDKFQNYYKDVSCRVKDREVDILLVVNMFLTGFDATTVNTLWLDKQLRLHGLLQAYSRTNRILNSVKTFGNIVCFRDLDKATNDSIALFGDKEAKGVVLLRSYHDYYNGYLDEGKAVKGYVQLVNELLSQFPIGKKIDGEESEKQFISLYGAILRRRNILTTFDKFEGNDTLTERQVQDYHSLYINLYNEFRKDREDGSEKENINDDVIFEMELIKQVEITVAYILKLIKQQYYDKHTEEKELLIDINKAIDASIHLRNKKDLINLFIRSLRSSSLVDDEWRKFTTLQREEELKRIIEEQNLKPDKTHEFMEKAFSDGVLKTHGVAFSKMLPDISLFSNERSKTRSIVEKKLNEFFDRFYDL